MVPVTPFVSEPDSVVPGGQWRRRRRWWWRWWCGGGRRGGRGGRGGRRGGRGRRRGRRSGGHGGKRFSVAAARSLGRAVTFAAAAGDGDVLAGRGRHLAVVVANVELGVQLEKVEAPVQRVRVEHVPPHRSAPPVETNVPRLVDYRLVPRVTGGQHFLVEQTLRAPEVFLK